LERKVLKDFISNVFLLDGRIRFVSIYQEQYMIAGGIREDRISLDPEEEAKGIDIQLSRVSQTARKRQC
jgi:hypothetical protein